MKKQTVSEDELAKHWGVTTRRVRQLQGEGIAVRTNGLYDLIESDKRFIKWLRSDEETLRLKRRMLAQQMMIAERKLQRSERELLTVQEVRDVLNQAWARMWLTHSNVANHFHNGTFSIPNHEQRTHVACNVEANCRGELKLLESYFTELTKEAMTKLTCELRNGIFRCDREIALLKAEYGRGEDDDEEDRAHA